MKSTDTDSSKIAQISTQLGVLNDEYTTLLKQYEQISTDYKHLLESQQMTASAVSIDPSGNSAINGTIGATVTGKAELYATVPSATYWGQMGLSEGTAHTPSECLVDCYSKPACTGATFDQETNYCWIRSGDGKVAPGKKNQTAIIKKTQLYGYQLEDLKAQLKAKHTQIMDLISSNQGLFEKNEQLREKRQEVLAVMQQQQGVQAAEFVALKRQHDSIMAADETSSLLVNRNYAQYLGILFIVVVLGIFLFKILTIKSSEPSPIANVMEMVGGRRSGHRGAHSGGSMGKLTAEGFGLGFITDTVESIGEMFGV